ncbi:MAG TPA: hypothetical protein VHR66_01740 [Gemmataceae bacterium]|jgi:hypothetical protein|nr:hypothetical protein [Gemmataceae bacterium]
MFALIKAVHRIRPSHRGPARFISDEAGCTTFYDRYSHNVGLAQRIERSLPDDLSWVSVALFYAAVHLLNAYLLSKSSISGFSPTSAVDTSRQKLIEDHCPELKAHSRRYRQLNDLSESVRYDPGLVFSPKHLSGAKADFASYESFLLPKVKKRLVPRQH